MSDDKSISQDYVYVNAALIRTIGIKQAVWLSFMMERLDRVQTDKNNYFLLRFQPGRIKLGLSKKEQSSIISNLKAFKIVKIKKVLLPKQKLYCKIDVQQTIRLVNNKLFLNINNFPTNKKNSSSTASSSLYLFSPFPPPLRGGRGEERERKRVKQTKCVKLSETKKKRSETEKERKVTKTDSTIEQIVDHWNKLGKPLTKHKKNKTSDVYRNILKNTRKCLAKNSIEIIIQSITDYHRLLNTKGSFVLKAVPLSIFFKLDEFNRAMLRRSDFDLISWFEESKKGYDYLLLKYTRRKKDNHPDITKSIRDWWTKTFTKRKLTLQDENNFILFGQKLSDFIDHNKTKLGYDAKYSAKFIKIITTILETKELRVIHTGYLVNEIIFEELSDYLFD